MVSTCFHRFESTKQRFQQALGILKKLRTVQEQEREREREREVKSTLAGIFGARK